MRLYKAGSIIAALLLIVACGETAPSPENAVAGNIDAVELAATGPDWAPLPTVDGAVDYQFVDLKGNKGKLSDFRGKVTMVDVWATWCGPCKMEIPHFIELYDEYKDQGFEMIGLSVDANPSAIAPFADEYKINYNMHWAPHTGRQIGEVFGALVGYPTTFLIDKDGKIVNKWIGYRDKVIFEDAIKALL